MKEDTLTDMVEAMREDVGLVHQMPYTCDGVGLPSTLEKVTTHTPSSCVATLQADSAAAKSSVNRTENQIY